MILKFSFLIYFFLVLSNVQAQLYILGIEGRDGPNGRDGRSGESGNSVSLYARDGGNYNLDAHDGEYAENGQPGQDAYNCYIYQYPDYDLKAANGGDGGRGGNGGTGGSGGHITIYGKDQSNLKNIFVSSRGGRGGDAGYGSRGGQACYCPSMNWQFRYTCRVNNQDQICYRTHYCANGQNGRDGYSGQHGLNGNAGHLTLIPLDQNLPSENPSISLPIAQTIGNTQTLSKHIWEERMGAISVLAPGSFLDNRYTLYKETRTKNMEVRWEAANVRAEESGLYANFSFDGVSDYIQFTGDALVQTIRELENQKTIYKVTQFYFGRDIRDLRPARLFGRGKETKFFIENASNLGNIGNLDIHLIIKKKKVLHNKTLFEGLVPASVIARAANGFTITVGAISVEPEDNYDENGDKYEVELKITRSLSNSRIEYNSGEVKIVLE